MTNNTGDFGADLIVVSQKGKRIIQAKRYSKKVGVRAVQEISSAKNYYDADHTTVVTNNYYTKSAQELAEINNVLLIDRDGLKKLIAESKSHSAINQNKRVNQRPNHEQKRRVDKRKKEQKKGFIARLFNL